MTTSLHARVKPLLDKIDAAMSGSDDASKGQRAALAAFTIRVLSAAIAFLSQVILARIMGTFEYGIFVLVWVMMVIIGNLSCLGFPTSMIRFIPQYLEKKDFDPLRGLLISSRIFVLISSSLAALLTMAIVYFGQSMMQDYYVLPFIVGCLTIPMIALGDTLDGTARGNGWAVRALTPTFILRPILILVLMIAAWALGYTINGVTGLVCAVIATYITSLIQLTGLSYSLRRAYPAGPKKRDMRTWLLVALPIFLVDGFFYLLTNADIMMVGFLMTPEDVAVYFAAVKTMALVHFVFFAVRAGVGNLFAARIHDDDKTALRDLARQTATWTFWPTLALALAILAAGPFLLAMFGEAFTHGYPLMFILIAGVIVRASVGPAESLLIMSGNHNICAIIFGCILAINVGLNFALIPAYGLYGAAIATATATTMETLVLYIIVNTRIGVSMFVFSKAPQQKV